MRAPALLCVLAHHSPADEQAVLAAARGNLNVKQKSLESQVYMQPGSSCHQRRWWLHAKYPWPPHRGAVIITTPHVPSGERLSSWNTRHFTDLLSGIVTTCLRGRKCSVACHMPCRHMAKKDGDVKGQGRVAEVRILIPQVERPPDGFQCLTHLPVGHREQVPDFFVAWAHLGSSADLDQAGLGWGSFVHLQPQGLARLCLWCSREWKNAHPVATVRWAKRKIKPYRPRALII